MSRKRVRAAAAAAVLIVGLGAVARCRRAARNDGWIALDDEPVAVEPDPARQDASPTPLTDDHLARLTAFVVLAHQELTARRPELSDTLVAGALAQGAAAHRLDPAAGGEVEGFDVWLFYARRAGVAPVNPRGLAGVYDFGPSDLGRHPDDPEGFTGRRVEVLTRTIDADGLDPADAVRGWLGSRNPSPQKLRRRPVIMLWPQPRCGEVVWAGSRP
jgi:hypothetical protein